jgi:LysM repeat protein
MVADERERPVRFLLFPRLARWSEHAEMASRRRSPLGPLGSLVVLLGCLGAPFGACGKSKGTADHESVSAAPEPKPPVTAAPKPEPSTYAVQPNDFWPAIAAKTGSSLEDLLAANSATIRTVLHPGDVLRVPDNGGDAVVRAAPSAPLAEKRTLALAGSSRPPPTQARPTPPPA